MPELARLLRRDCVTCPSTQPACSCAANEKCIVTVKTCTQCSEARCELINMRSSSASGKSAGPIAGGVVGGLVGVGLIIGFLLWYKFRQQRNQHLQSLDEAALEDDSPPESLNYDIPTREQKTPSIISTYGGASRRSNVIPIMFPFSRANDSEPININRNIPLHDGSRINLTTNRDSVTALPMKERPLTLRDSIRDSEYSMQIDNPLSPTPQGLRAYDVAVQGIPNLIDVGRQRKRAQPPPNLRRISETGSQSPAEELETEAASIANRRISKRRSLASTHSVFDPLPEINDVASQLDISSLKSMNITKVGKGDIESTSPFDDSASEQQPASERQRYSVASSNAYSAHLPEDAKIYHGYGLL